jgi:hypothetical protein
MKLKVLFCCVGLATASTTFVLPAQASTLSFVISGVDNATFSLDSKPGPTGQVDVGHGANNPYFADVAGTNSGSPIVFPFLTFYTPTDRGGLSAGLQPGDIGTNFFDLLGDLIFSGPGSAPVFSPGVFALGADTLTVSATPLPAALPLFATGLGVIGLLGWRRKRKTAAA